MAKFEYTYNSADIDVAYLTIDDIFDITFIRRETGIEIDVLEHDGEASLGRLFVHHPHDEEE